jgi:hypothetical protein
MYPLNCALWRNIFAIVVAELVFQNRSELKPVYQAGMTQPGITEKGRLRSLCSETAHRHSGAVLLYKSGSIASLVLDEPGTLKRELT